MFGKLAFRNVCRQIRSYLIYFVTVALSIALMFAVNNLSYSDLFRQLAEQMRLPVASYGSLKVVGGGSKNEVWMQTLANVLEVKIEKMEGMIGPAFGIALLASGMRDGRVSMEAITRDCLRVEKVYEPDPEAVIFYEEKYRKYLRIHDAMKYIDDGSLLSPVK